MRKVVLIAGGIFLLSNIYAQSLKVMVVTGGHSYDSVAFFNLFESMSGIEYKHFVQPDANNDLIYGVANQYDVLVFYDMWKTISEEEKEAYINITNAGKPMLFLHHALVSYQNWPEFENLIGGRYIENEDLPEEEQSTYRHDVWVNIEIADEQHPVTAGIDNFKLFDEVYGNYKVLPIVKPLLLTNHLESSRVIGWENQYNASTVIYIQPGHDNNSYSSEDYKRLIRQALFYLVKNNKAS